MTFLNPAILFGLVAASIPVIIHFLNLKKLKKIEFSTLNFLKELQKNKIRKIKFKQWLLLALRVMIIIFIVAAFARPTLEGVSIGGTTSAAKTTEVFILDDTFSMSVVDQDGSYFNQAKQTIKSLLSNFEEGDECGLILISGNKEAEIEIQGGIDLVNEHLNDLLISDASGTINFALIRASKIMSRSKNFNKEIYLFTDFQKGRLAIDENIIDLSEVLTNQVKLYSFNYADKEVYNIGIDKLDTKTKIFEKNKPVVFEATVTNYSGQTAANLVVSLFVSGKRSSQMSIDLSPDESKSVELEGVVQENEYIDVMSEIEDDEILQDNERNISLYIPDKINVLLLYDNPDDMKFVKLAIQSAGFDEKFDLFEKPVNAISSLQLKNYDVIICAGIVNSDDSNTLGNYLTDGGGLIVFPSSDSDLQAYRSTLKYLVLPEPKDLIILSGTAGNTTEFEKIDKDHPLLQNIFRDEEKKEIQSPAINKYFKMMPMGKGVSIISLIDGSSFLSEYKNGNGKVFVFNIAPVLEWSDFPIKSIFAPLIYKSILYLSAKDRGGSEYIAGEPLNVNISRRISPLIKVVRPDKSEEIIHPDTSASDFISYTKTFITGNYKFYSGKELLETASVNPDPVESVVNYISDNEFDEYLNKINFKGSHIRIGKKENPSQEILKARFGSELWRYFLLVALVLALVEMAIAKSAKKEIINLGK